MPDISAHDAHVAQELARAVEASAPALAGCADAPASVREQAQPRREAAAELRAAAPSADVASGESLIERAAQALERLTGGGAAGEAEPRTAGRLDTLSDAEDALQARFETALADDRLSGPVRDAVLRAYDLVKTGHDAVRQAVLARRGEV